MISSRNENSNSWLRILLAMAAATAVSTASAMPRKYVIAGSYETRSEAARTASLIDLDQAEIERLLNLDLQTKDSKALDKARQIYENGMHAGVYASLTLTQPLDHKAILPDKPVESYYSNSITYDPEHHDMYELKVFGVSNNGAFDTPLQGVVKTTADTRGKTTLNVVYPEGSNCMVDDQTDDCFAGPSGGVVLQGYGAVDYTYNPLKDNKFAASLKSYSEGEGERMYYCENHGGCKHFQEYQHAFDFYGILDYGNHWIESAFASQKTDFPKDVVAAHHGFRDVDFSQFADVSRNAAISTATVVLNVFTQINRLMVEFGVDGCNKNTKDFSTYGSHLSMDSIVAAWDQAAALYAGSALFAPAGGRILSSTDEDASSGSLYYHMVQRLAEEFGALEVDPDTHEPVSMINRKVLQEFEAGRTALTQSDCEGEVTRAYYQIVHAMRAPWIQGVLKATFELAHSQYDDALDRETQVGTATAYVAALLPDLYHCSPEAAKVLETELGIIFPNTSASKLRPDYAKVRNALEHQYQCLGVTCDEIGGFLNPETGGYFEETRPCGGYGTMISQRRESVAVSPSSSLGASSASTPASSHQASFVTSHKTGFAMSGFFATLALFFVSLSVLVVTVHERAQGRPAHLGSTARRLVSGAMSTADYWLSRRTANQGDDYSPISSNYEVQLRPMESQTPLPPGSASLLL